MKFQHNTEFSVNNETYKYVYEYKKQLLFNITNLLNDCEIKFVISHGNLIEYERKQPIYHDDDLDIRFDMNDLPKWKHFCNNNDIVLHKYNLILDDRLKNIEKQKYDGIQCRLIKFDNQHNIKEYKMDIHSDLVMNIVESDFWKDYKINFNNLRKIIYLDVETYAPSSDDAIKVLTLEYGPTYLIPDIKNKSQNIYELIPLPILIILFFISILLFLYIYNFIEHIYLF